MFIPLLETIRKANLIDVYEKVAQECKNLNNNIFISLDEISKKIDYEKHCNSGLYSRSV